MSTHPNLILKHLSKRDLALFEGALTAKSFVHGDVLADAGSPIENVYFPNSGLISIAWLSELSPLPLRPITTWRQCRP